MNKTSIFGPWPTDAEDDYTTLEAHSDPSVEILAFDSEKACGEARISEQSIRMFCLRMLLEEEASTIQECSEASGLSGSLIALHFRHLDHLGLIEREGIRFTKAGFQRTFRLRLSHPAMEFLLGPAPRGVTPSQILLKKYADVGVETGRR